VQVAGVAGQKDSAVAVIVAQKAAGHPFVCRQHFIRQVDAGGLAKKGSSGEE